MPTFPAPDPRIQPILARRLIREGVVSAITNGNILGVNIPTLWNIYSPGDWPTPPEKLPAVLVRTSGDNKTNWQAGQTSFDTTVSIHIFARVVFDDPEPAQDAIEQLGYAIEGLLFTDYWLRRVIKKYSSIQTTQFHESENNRHSASFEMIIAAETQETFQPYTTSPIASTWPPAAPGLITPTVIHTELDLIEQFDPNNVYDTPGVDTDFPNSAIPPPRTSGPDGRIEAVVETPVTQD